MDGCYSAGCGLGDLLYRPGGAYAPDRGRAEICPDLKDAQGNVRGWMRSTIGKGSELTLGNVNAQPMVRLVVSTDSSDLHLFGGPKSGLNLSGDSGNPDISMITAEGNGEARIAFSEHGPSFTLQDAKGFSMIAGAAPAEKTTSHKSGISGASIVLLDKEKKIIWQAP